MGGVERRGDLREDRGGPARWQRSRLEDRLEVGAVDVSHVDEQHAVDLAEVVDRDHVGFVQAGSHARIAVSAGRMLLGPLTLRSIGSHQPEVDGRLPNNEFGDFQTPRLLAQALVKTLPVRPWARVLEPTCGVGNFLRAAVDVFPDADTVGIETQEAYVAQARSVARVVCANVFTVDLANDIPWRSADGPTLVLGNPPWVTNAQLSSLGSANRPARTNFKKATGIEAITGSSNFDVAEYIWVKLLAEYSGRDTTIALICKTQVARNVLLHSAGTGVPVTSASIRLIDAKKWFNAAVDACWFTMNLGSGPPDYLAEVYPDLEATTATSRLGVRDGRLVSDVDAHTRSAHFDGISPVTWRQGVKHDATQAMELIEVDGPTTKAGVAVDVESDYVFPLFKCTDVHRNRLADVARWMIVPQRHPGEDTAALEHVAPKLWSYLVSHGDLLDGRRSSIYRNRPRFSIFGVGEYTFAPYKVVVSGFHAVPVFRIVGPRDGKPAVFDDATYLLPFDDLMECAVAQALLTSPEASELITSLVFQNSKRPITKKLLQRIDLLAIAGATDAASHRATALAEVRRFRSDATEVEVGAALDRLLAGWSEDVG